MKRTAFLIILMMACVVIDAKVPKKTKTTTTTTTIAASNVQSKDFILVEGGETCSSFYICDHEVTQGEFRSVMGVNPSKVTGDNRPVENVSWYLSWYDAVEYCNALSLKEGLTPCYTIDKNNEDPNSKSYFGSDPKWTVTWDKSANGYRLPTENEWEWAAKGGKKSKGYEYSGSNVIYDVAWCGTSDKGVTHDVKTKQPNELGIYDMTGNVWEVCWDWYGDDRPNIKDYSGPSSGALRVIRGSGCDFYIEYGNDRYCDWPPYKESVIGFRIARSAK